MIRHHPDDEILLAHAAGRLDSGRTLVLDAHLETCAHCARRMLDFEALGGVLLDDFEPSLLRPDAFARTVARAVAQTTVHLGPAPAPWRPPLPEGTAWPRSMAGCEVSRWRWLGPGMRWSRVTLPYDSANVFLLRIGAGKSLPPHTHSDCELTQVLYGSFDDGRSVFGPGDFDATDGSVHHQPVVAAGGECICLASVNGKVVFDGLIARVLGSLVGM